jgi:hypothetical protein
VCQLPGDKVFGDLGKTMLISWIGEGISAVGSKHQALVDVHSASINATDWLW